MDNIAQVLNRLKQKTSGKYLSAEWQLYGYKLAKFLDDSERVSLYMRLAKNEDRTLLQNALDFVKESKPRVKSRLYLWKLKQLKLEKKSKIKTDEPK